MKNRLFLTFSIISLLLTGCSGTTTTNSSSEEDSTIKVQNINVNVHDLSIAVNKRGQLVASVFPNNATNQELQYEVSEGQDLITIDENGLVTGKKAGRAQITITPKDGSDVEKIIGVTVIAQEENVDLAFPIDGGPKYTYHDLLPSWAEPSFGNQKILVLPIALAGDKGNATTSHLEMIRKAYQGTQEEVGYMSVSDYFSKASAGALNYDCHVPDKWYQAPSTYTPTYVRDNNWRDLIPLALKWFKETYTNVNIADFDKNSDGIVDNIHAIYSASYDKTGTGLWGYRTSVEDTINTDGYKASNAVWYSARFLANTQDYGGVPKNGVNTKIAIHENGHILGLSDYYDTAYKGLSLVGQYDMQSNNVLDWNSFSKYSVGWVKPRIVGEDYLKEHGSATITLSSASLDGDCLILKNKNFMGIPFDEYIMLELFNPDAPINYYDTHSSTINNLKKIGYGVRIYHVDARMVQEYQEDYVDKYEVVTKDNFNRENVVSRRVISGNTANSTLSEEYYPYNQIGAEYMKYNLLHLLQKGGTNTFGKEDKSARGYLINGDMWQTNDTFCIGTHTGFKDYGNNFFVNKTTFNDGSELPFALRFDKVTPNSATITVTYVGA